MEFHPIVRAAGPRDAGAFAWLNRQFNGEGVASEEEAAAALQGEAFFNMDTFIVCPVAGPDVPLSGDDQIGVPDAAA